MQVLTELPYSMAGRVFASPMPYGGFDPSGYVLEAYERETVSTVLMLVSDEEAFSRTGFDLHAYYVGKGFRVLQLAIEDFSIPQLSELHNTGSRFIAEAQAGKNMAFHCYAGIGRTGTFAAYLAWRLLRLDPEAAVLWVRQFIPHAVEAPEQMRLLRRLEGEERP